MADNEVSHYRLIISGHERDKLLRWAGWAKQIGVLDEYLVALKTINFRLSFEPVEWGEAKYPLEELDLYVYFGTFKMLNVWYAVHRRERIVFVKMFQFRGDYPHGRPPNDV